MNRAFKILITIETIINFSNGLFLPFYSIFAEHIGGDILTLSFAYCAYCISGGILLLIIGDFTNHLKIKEKVLILGYIVGTIATFCYLFVRNPMELFFVEILTGISFALYSPPWDALWSINIDIYNASKESSIYEGGIWLVAGVAVVIGGVIIDYYGYNMLFLIMGMIQTILTIILITYSPLELQWFRHHNHSRDK